MNDFRTSLLREKFVITPHDDKDNPTIALSNRMTVHLISPDKIDDEVFVVRTQNMHSCARFAAAILKEFQERGTLANRIRPVPWADLWFDITKGYEKDWNPDIWCVIYYRGRKIFSDGTHNPFVDIIEQCDAKNKGEYADSIKFAEEAFVQAGKKVKIDHDSNIALVISVTEEQAKSGVIVRSASGSTTFNYTAIPSKKTPRPIQPYTVITVAAAYLEAVQLAFKVGLLNKKNEFGLIEKYSDEDKQRKKGTSRLSNLDRAITNYESTFVVTYRPERPDFKAIVTQAADHSAKILKPQLENDSNWL